MKSVYDPAVSEEIRMRIARLSPQSPRQWGKMTPSQAAAHLCSFLEMALDEVHAPRMFAGRLIGPIVKHFALRDEKPMPRNLPTVPGYAVTDDREFIRERDRLATLVDRLCRGGSAGCTAHPHSFFGRMTPEEWGRLTYKHLDHHLRQFGV